MADNVASLIKFTDLCTALQTTRNSKKQDRTSALTDFIRKYKQKAAELKDTNANANVSFYPALRLILPHLERERGSYGIKELTLAKRLVKILCLPPNGVDAQRLTNFRGTSSSTSITDFADAAHWVLKKHFIGGPKLSIADVNKYLDAIAEAHADNNPREVDAQIYKLLQESAEEEQRWLLRIILKEVRLGIGQDRILNLYHPDASALFTTNNSLSKICDTLTDSSVRLHEIEVCLFSPFRPMLSQRCDIAKFNKLFASDMQIYIETKFDGERFQLHMENNKFKYFSRNAFDYTNTYGETFSTGFYTPLLKNAFEPHVKSIILDGEMMGWNTITKQFGSKGMDFDVKHLKSSNIHQPCYCVFDILFLNGAVLTNKPLKERLLILDKVLKPVQGLIITSHRVETNSKTDVINALNASMDREEEGIVFKDVKSLYKSNDRNAGWWKMKLEYFENVMCDLDLIIMGGYFGDGKNIQLITGFLVGIAAPPSSGERLPSAYLSLAKVASGLNKEELDTIKSKLGHHWKKKGEGDPQKFGLQWGRDVPDMWIQPKHSCIVEIRASELMRVHSFDFKTDYTLRFPRIQKIRLDKPYYDCLTVAEFDELTSNSSKIVKKLNKRHLELSDLEAPEKAKRLRKGMESIEIQPVEQKSELLTGYEFFVLTGYEDWKKDKIEFTIRENGGTAVRNEGTKTLCILVGDDHPRVSTCIQYDAPYDLVKVHWLRNVLETNTFHMYSPTDMLHTSKNTRNRFLKEYDKYGDSYTEDATLESMKNVVKLMETSDDYIHLTPREISTLKKELNISHPLNVFENDVAYFDKMGNDYTSYNNVEHPTVEEMEFKFLGGTVSSVLNENVTLVVMEKSNELRKKGITAYLEDINNEGAKIVTKKFINENLAAVHASFR